MLGGKVSLACPIAAKPRMYQERGPFNFSRVTQLTSLPFFCHAGRCGFTFSVVTQMYINHKIIKKIFVLLNLVYLSPWLLLSTE
jgi:hypothetical protein